MRRSLAWIGLSVAVVAFSYGGLLLFAFVASDPEVGAGIAYGNLNGDAQIAIALCPGEEVQRISVYASESERPPRSSLLWEVREPTRDLNNQLVVTIGRRDGFRYEPKKLSKALPRTIQVEYESTSGGIDAVMADRDDLFKLKDGQWHDGDHRVTLKNLKAAGC